MRKSYDINESILDDIDTEFSMYFLGFMYADGNILTPKDRPNVRRISISQSNKDFDVLKSISDIITPGYSFATRLRDNCSDWQINSKKIYDRLTEFGLIQNKSLTIGFPELNYVNKRHFVRAARYTFI